jgi:hypothetical protein
MSWNCYLSCSFSALPFGTYSGAFAVPSVPTIRPARAAAAMAVRRRAIFTKTGTGRMQTSVNALIVQHTIAGRIRLRIPLIRQSAEIRERCIFMETLALMDGVPDRLINQLIMTGFAASLATCTRTFYSQPQRRPLP